MSIGANGNIYFTEGEREAALQNNSALEYALSRGYPLERVGNEYHHKDHSSMVFRRDGKWFWNSQGESGGAIDFIQIVEGKSYAEAICTLAGSPPYGNNHQIYTPVHIEPAKKGVMVLPERDDNYRTVYAYLTKERKINPDLVRQLLKDRKIYQAVNYSGLRIVGYDEAGKARYDYTNPDLRKEGKGRVETTLSNTRSPGLPYTKMFPAQCLTPEKANALISGAELLDGKKVYTFRNLIMLGYNNAGEPKYASLRSTNTNSKKAVKMDVTGSDKSYPFILNEKAESNTVCVLESPIEVMSYYSLCQLMNSPLSGAYMISLGGANSTRALSRFLEDHPNVTKIIPALNNDSTHEIDAGKQGITRIQKGYRVRFSVQPHTPHLNDWNEVLKNYHSRGLGEVHRKISQTKTMTRHTDKGMSR